jgi:hypothetical protein
MRYIVKVLELNLTPESNKHKRTIERIIETDVYDGMYLGSPFKIEVRSINHSRRRFSKSRGVWVTVLRSVRDVSIQMQTQIDVNTQSIFIRCERREVVQAQVHDERSGVTSTKTKTQLTTTTVTQVVQTVQSSHVLSLPSMSLVKNASSRD